MRVILGALVCLGLVASCRNTATNAQALFYQDGSQKPVVALVPVFDHTTSTVEWNLSEEMTHEIVGRLLQKDKLYLTPRKKVETFISQLRKKQNPFSLDIAWAKDAFQDQEFAVFMELLEHEEAPLKTSPEEDPKLCSAELRIALRVRVLDLRGDDPKIVLQEIIRHNHHLPRQFTKHNFYQDAWGECDFPISTLGLAHAQLTKEAASRIEEYILLARGNL